MSNYDKMMELFTVATSDFYKQNGKDVTKVACNCSFRESLFGENDQVSKEGFYIGPVRFVVARFMEDGPCIAILNE